MAAHHPALAVSPLFAGLSDAELDAVAELMRPVRFEAGEEVCRSGEPADTIWVLTAGLVHWLAPTTEGAGELILRLRKGDPIGAQDAIVGEPRSATVVASITTSALEMDAGVFLEAMRRYPEILINVIRNQRQRLNHANARRTSEKQRGEEIGLAAGPSLAGLVGPLVAAARAAAARPVSILDRRLSFAGALTAADALATEPGTVLLPSELDPVTLGPLLEEVDRVVALAGSAEEVQRLGELSDAARGHLLEVVLVGEEAASAAAAWPSAAKMRVVKTCAREPDFPLTDADLGWVARHLTRTKLGIALGAGGAKGYAHVGVLQVLEENGYVVDFAGGSIGGFVASHVARGHDAAGVEAIFRAAFDEENVSALFSSPFGGGAAGLEALTRLLREATEDSSFADTVIPLVIMAVDLTDRAPAPLREGPIWEALLAALAVAGVFPPQERDGHRLVDGLALVPVPTASVVEDGADVVVSVNLMGAETLDRWPDGGPELEDAAPKKRRGMLDTLLEVMDLSQLDTSARHAALADVVVTPRFAPSDWRDFQLADLFLAAGRSAALERLPELQALSRPIDPDAIRRHSWVGTVA